jgi:hypothetical protein
MFMPNFFHYYVDIYTENTPILSKISNYACILNAQNLRLYYLSNILNLDETNSINLMLKCGITSHQDMILNLMETIARYGINLDGVSCYELLLRHIMNKSGYLINPNMFNAKFIYSGVEDKIRYD